MSEDKPNSEVGSGASASPGADVPTAHGLQPMPLDLVSPQFTLRAVLTGMVLAALFSACNIYLGLKIGLALNMSITAALVGYGLWMGLRGLLGVRKLEILENNINQTACSSGALVASAGLTAPIPALTLLTGQTLEWHWLALWVFSICMVGIIVAVLLRRQMLLEDKLPFAVGVASAATLRELYAKGSEGLKRVAVLGAAALVASPVYWLTQFSLPFTDWRLPRLLPLTFSIKGFSARSLTFGLDTTLLLYALGGLIGFRTCVSLLVGSIVAWGVLAPNLIHGGYLGVQVSEPRPRELIGWLLWPGVALMVMGSLTSLAFSHRSVVATFTGGKKQTEEGRSADTGEVRRRWVLIALTAALVLSVVLQICLFQIVWWATILGVLLAFILAMVAGRVSGETGITPVAQMQKVAQITFGALLPGRVAPNLMSANVAPNLMSANVAGGAASQCADLLHDLKCGLLLGASPRLQTLAQLCGALTGALVGSAVYLILIPNPAEQLITDEWAAPGVVGMKAVAEVFVVGFAAMPRGTPLAMLVAGIAGIVLALTERVAPKRIRPFTVSPASIGLAFVIPAHYSMTIFVGGAVALLLATVLKSWTTRYLITVCAGLVAGESLTAVGTALYRIDWAQLVGAG